MYVLRREFGTTEKLQMGDSSHYFHGRSWYNSCMFDHADYKAKNRRCPIQQECTEHRSDDGSIEYELIAVRTVVSTI
jgi:hypothetical protein